MDKYNVLWIQFIQSSFSKGFQQGHFLKALKENKLSCYKTEMEIQKKKKRTTWEFCFSKSERKTAKRVKSLQAQWRLLTDTVLDIQDEYISPIKQRPDKVQKESYRGKGGQESFQKIFLSKGEKWKKSYRCAGKNK